MTDAIEKMKEEGWELAKEKIVDGNHEYLKFRRPRQPPNAIVNFRVLQQELDNPVLNLSECWKRRIISCIQKVEP